MHTSLSHSSVVPSRRFFIFLALHMKAALPEIEFLYFPL
jgi:hypothetical protein